MRVIKVGRNPVNDVVVSDPGVSSQHAVITVSSSGIVCIKDLNSKNGTFVNSMRIQNQVQLSNGDKVKLGNTSIDWNRIIQQPEKTVVSAGKGQVIIPPDVKDRRSIGRSSEAQVRLNFDDVSSEHAILCQRSNGDVLIIDNNSTNGTYVNGNRISSHVLVKGDVVLISKKYPLQWENIFALTPPKGGYLWQWGSAFLILLAVSVGIWYYWTHRSLPPEEIYEKYQKSVVLIYQKTAYVASVGDKLLGEYMGDDSWNYFYLDDKDDVCQGVGGSSGTGFFISTDGKIMTNKHVVSLLDGEKEKAEKVKETIQMAIVKRYPNNAGALALARAVTVKYNIFYTGVALNDTHVSSVNDFIPCSICKVSNDDKIDIAIIQVNTKKTPDGVVNIVDLNDIVTDKELQLGKKVYTIGFPQSFILGDTEIGLEANNQSGEITQQRGEYQYGHNITIHQGASGSPVFNERGKFVGVIVSGYLGLSQGYNQAVQPKRAVELIK